MTALLFDQWISIFFLHLTRELKEKAITELYRYGVTRCVPVGHCTDPRSNPPTHTVAVTRGLRGGQRGEAKGVRQNRHCR